MGTMTRSNKAALISETWSSAACKNELREIISVQGHGQEFSLVSTEFSPIDNYSKEEAYEPMRLFQNESHIPFGEIYCQKDLEGLAASSGLGLRSCEVLNLECQHPSMETLRGQIF